MNKNTHPAAAAGTLRLGDLVVNRMGFGAMRATTGGPDIWGPPRDRAAAKKVLHRALELGINFIDTADSYGPEVSETARWDPDGRPEHLRRALEGSLKRLKLERVDLYQLHAPDPKVPFADSVGVLADAWRTGKIRHIGLSNVSVKKLEAARRIAPIVSVQNEYNLENRESEGVLEACERLGIAFIPWFPLGEGKALGSRKLKRAAAKLGSTPAQVALAWLLARSSAMLPIPGTASIAHLEENTAAAALKLSPEDLAELG